MGGDKNYASFNMHGSGTDSAVTVRFTKTDEEHPTTVSTEQEDNNAIYSLLEDCQDADETHESTYKVNLYNNNRPVILSDL